MAECCVKCGHPHVVKNGFVAGRQRFKCKSCHYQFTTEKLERGKPLWMKLEAVLLYISGLSLNAIAENLDVSAQAVLNWVRDFARANIEKPEPGKVVVVELDEFWHFVEFKKNRIWIWKAYDRDHGQLIDWELGNRDCETVERLLERLAQWQVTVYCTDGWQGFESLLDEHPDAYHVATKTETKAIERNNSDHRHWFARFKRKSKVVSKSLEMVDLTMALFAKFRVNGNIELLRNWRLSLLT
ncbi:IS1 family transposase [Trichothermofontia sichuanensis]|uniref:IS1 family transposase n=1 Tax=Trichothermofontia sichuanensis TaxID=3045816 RepID=UPI00249F2BCF